MQKAKTVLSAEFYLSIALSLLFVVLFESGFLPSGEWALDKTLEFKLLSIMEIVTIVCIPLALRLFKFKAVNQRLTTGDRREEFLITFGMVRLNMLCLPMIANVLLYYLFMHVAFGYMGIILFLCLFFVVPTADRCRAETMCED
ncbi:MAG TPA: hypothetical protein VIQ97_04245 [Prevotella sp.]